MAKRKKKKTGTDKPKIKRYSESYPSLSSGAKSFLGGKFQTIEKQKEEEENRRWKEKLHKKPFGGKIGFKGGTKPKVSASSGIKSITRMFN